ncbi:hypothetical protein B0H67DRAFT_645045 [Lasiosphaeris hirsuta]|uniref:Uncharacterized protein n=1 Tax=Lasiosphaeris hirsuta TaxID=260670 RepID=A0AA40AGE0_9PEZI|nr:hypothetical protein B0H67DRAFT_645045 [Lasiosphaeris hirsuta]
MSDNTVYLVTGANRGIGLALTTQLLHRPHTTVIATSRNLAPDVFSPLATTAHPGNKLITVLLDDADPALGADTLAARLRDEHDVEAVDVVVANAGGSAGFRGILETEAEDLVGDFVVNAVGPVKLFRGVWGLMGGGEGRKFVLVTSSVGSIGGLEEESFPSTAYGMSKAAANWFAKKLSVEFREAGLLVGVVHPGWVKTPMGQALADAINFKEPPMSVEESAKAVIEQIDGLTPEKSGQFLMYDGKQMPW